MCVCLCVRCVCVVFGVPVLLLLWLYAQLRPWICESHFFQLRALGCSSLLTDAVAVSLNCGAPAVPSLAIIRSLCVCETFVWGHARHKVERVSSADLCSRRHFTTGHWFDLLTVYWLCVNPNEPADVQSRPIIRVSVSVSAQVWLMMQRTLISSGCSLSLSLPHWGCKCDFSLTLELNENSVLVTTRWTDSVCSWMTDWLWIRSVRVSLSSLCAAPNQTEAPVWEFPGNITNMKSSPPRFYSRRIESKTCLLLTEMNCSEKQTNLLSSQLWSLYFSFDQMSNKKIFSLSISHHTSQFLNLNVWQHKMQKLQRQCDLQHTWKTSEQLRI